MSDTARDKVISAHNLYNARALTIERSFPLRGDSVELSSRFVPCRKLIRSLLRDLRRRAKGEIPNDADRAVALVREHLIQQVVRTSQGERAVWGGRVLYCDSKAGGLIVLSSDAALEVARQQSDAGAFYETDAAFRQPSFISGVVAKSGTGSRATFRPIAVWTGTTENSDTIRTAFEAIAYNVPCSAICTHERIASWSPDGTVYSTRLTCANLQILLRWAVSRRACRFEPPLVPPGVLYCSQYLRDPESLAVVLLSVANQFKPLCFTQLIKLIFALLVLPIQYIAYFLLRSLCFLLRSTAVLVLLE